MNKDIKDKWIEALRSDKYTQGKGYLHQVQDNSYCCLGVLCDILDVPKQNDCEYRSADGDIYRYGTNDTSVFSMPANIAHQIGIDDVVQGKLQNMNDGNDDMRSHSFTEIANYIEKNL